MPMKLLNKSEQSKAKAREKDLDIQEGLKLAKKVDSLREISAHEEKALKDFRKSTLEEISKEILKESAKKDALMEEVKILEDRKSEALKTLDLEWDKVKLAQGEATRKEEALLSRLEAIKVVENEIQSRNRDLSTKEAQIETLKLLTESRLHDAEESRKEAGDNLDTTHQILVNAQDRVKQLINNAEAKEKYIIDRERNVFKKEEELRNKEIELAIKESELKDKYATLERSIKRLKK